MRSTNALLCALSLLPACRKQATQDPPPPSAATGSATASVVSAPSTSAPVPQPPKVTGIEAVVTRGGMKHELRSALVWAYEGSALLHLELSTHARTCEDLKSENPRLVRSEHVFEMVLAPPLKPAADWNVATIFQTDETGTTSPVISTYGTVRPKATDPAANVSVSFTSSTGDVAVAGSVDAKGCGRHARPQPEPARSELKALILEVDGQKVPVVSAEYHAAQERLVIADTGAACEEEAFEARIALVLGKKRAALTGYAINADERLDEPPKYTLGPPKDGAVDGTFQVDVTIGGHRVKLTGKGRVVACD